MAHLQQPLESALEKLQEQASKDRYIECTLIHPAMSLIADSHTPSFQRLVLGKICVTACRDIATFKPRTLAFWWSSVNGLLCSKYSYLALLHRTGSVHNIRSTFTFGKVWEGKCLFVQQVMKPGGCGYCLTNCNISCRKPMEEASSETLAKAVIKPRWQERAKKSLSNERSLSTGDTGRW